MNIVQISDTHFGTEQPLVERALIENLRATPPDVILLTGDVTQRARRSQYAAAQSFLKRLPSHHFMVIPGNHDIPLYNLWGRLTNPYGGFKQAFSRLEATWISDACTIIAINSTDPARHKDGVFSQEKIDQVAAQLEASRHSQVRIVAAHHPVAVVLPIDAENITHNAELAVKTWSAAGMDVILGGHIHYPFIAPVRQHYPNINTSAWIMQAGTAISRRVRNQKSNSFNRIVMNGDRESTRMEQWNYEGDLRQFKLGDVFTPWS